jgi:hypothetical protein
LERTEETVPKYDPKIIQDHADELYAQAEKLPLLTAYASGLIGLVVGLGTGMGMDIGGIGGSVFGVLLGVGAAVIGFQVGRSQAIRFRVAAQTALCQVAIEQAIKRPE